MPRTRNAQPPSPRRFWQALGLLTFGLVVALLFARSRRIAREWDSMLVAVDEYADELATREDARSPTWGVPDGGLAAPFYLTAMERATALDEDVAEAASLATTVDERGARDRWVAANASLIEELRAGARGSSSGWPALDSKPPGALYFNVFGVGRLVRLVLAKVYADVEAGRSVEGVETLLDLLQFIRDLGQAPVLIGEVVAHSLVFEASLERFFASGGWQQLSREALDRLQSGLAILLEQLPAASSSLSFEVVGSVAVLRANPQILGRSSVLDVSFRCSARRAYSFRWELADSFRTSRTLVEDARASQRLGLGEAHAGADALQQQLLATDNLVVDMLLPVFPDVLRQRARAHARLRLLAGALAVVRGEPERLPEVLGDAFLAEHVRVRDEPEHLILDVPGPDTADWFVDLGR